MSAVVAMNEETRRIEQFNDIVANIKLLMIVGKGKNQRVITGSAVVPLSLCFVDVRYQGMRAHKHLNRLRNKWDERKLTPIILVWHLEEHRFAIVDGQGRFIIAGEKGIDRLNAIILMDAPEDPDERLKFENRQKGGRASERPADGGVFGADRAGVRPYPCCQRHIVCGWPFLAGKGLLQQPLDRQLSS